MLRVDDRKNLSSPFPLIAKAAPEKSTGLQRLDPAPSVPLIARDSYVAETATRIDQLQATVRMLTRDLGQLAGKVAELQDTASQEHRWYAFQQNEKRSRDGKLDETVRGCRDLKARLDKIEARSGGDYHAYNSFEAVSHKLAELERSRGEGQRTGRGDTFRAWLLSAAMVSAAGIIGLSLVLAGG